ncbi:hypothetical protein MFLAVUS_010300 [Mucor flavus]|uniref:Uncharacterized protein n=1 Tax=Mucor flavus TaxID=439312 RepID=A0ABP9ZCE0_9FUNG
MYICSPIQEIVFTVSLPETEEFSVESAPVESAPVVRLIYYNFHPYKFCGDIELVLEELNKFIIKFIKKEINYRSNTGFWLVI